jgi:hypothetical protein
MGDVVSYPIVCMTLIKMLMDADGAVTYVKEEHVAVVFADGGEQDAATHHASLKLAMEPFLNDDAYCITRLVVPTDGCAKQYYGKENFIRMKENARSDFYSDMLNEILHLIAVAAHYKGKWDAIGAAVGAVLQRIEKALQCSTAGSNLTDTDPTTGNLLTKAKKLVSAFHCKREYEEYLKAQPEAQAARRKSVSFRVHYLDKSTVKRHDKTKEVTTTIKGTKNHRAFMAKGGNFYVRKLRCGCMPCSNRKDASCINLDDVQSGDYTVGALGWSVAAVDRKAIEQGIAASRVKRTDLASSVSWQLEEKRIYGEIERSRAKTCTVVVFCGQTDATDNNGSLSFWIGDIVRCCSPSGGTQQALVHEPKKGFKSGDLGVKKGQKCVRVRWWQLSTREEGGVCEYEHQGGDSSEQWLLLSSVLPVSPALLQAGQAGALRIHSDELERIQEVTTWVPVPQQKKGERQEAQGYAAHTNPELQAMCKAKGLPVGGVKSVLVSRLEASEAALEEADEEEADPPPPPAKKRKTRS